MGLPTPRDLTILLVSGSVREGSTNTSALHTVQELLPEGVTGILYDGLGALPHFNPDDDRDPLPAPVVRLRTAIAEADALLFCTPEYAGDMPGALKNMLEWTVGGVEIEGKPTGWINVSAAPGAAAGTHAMLRTVVGYTGGEIVEDACAHIPVHRDAVEGGLVRDTDTRTAMAAPLTALVSRAAAERVAADAATADAG